MSRYRPYLQLSPDEALARSRTRNWGNAQASGTLRIHTTGPNDTSVGRGRSTNKP